MVYHLCPVEICKNGKRKQNIQPKYELRIPSYVVLGTLPVVDTSPFTLFVFGKKETETISGMVNLVTRVTVFLRQTSVRNRRL